MFTLGVVEQRPEVGGTSALRRRRAEVGAGEVGAGEVGAGEVGGREVGGREETVIVAVSKGIPGS